MPLDVACVIGCAVQTGVGAVLNTAKAWRARPVLVLGLGGIGLSVVQGARVAGAGAHHRVGSGRRAARGGDAASARRTHRPDPDDVVARAREITRVGVDYAFECRRQGLAGQAGIAAARNGGTIVAVGAPPHRPSRITIESAALFTFADKHLLGCILGGVNSLRDIPRLISALAGRPARPREPDHRPPPADGDQPRDG